ncbi:small-conductance mechanosensitive channel [Rhodobiaceae bacterium]|nr:small-conductance mechanosensitive channel [Rhodobiaceae bacterium]
MPESLTAALPDGMRDNADTLLPLFVEHGLSIVGAVLILILGFWIAGRARAFTIKALDKPLNSDEMLKGFFGSIVRYLVIIATVLAVLGQFGVETTSLIAVLGAASLAIGLALQGTLSNVAAGVMLLVFRPFRVGQFVELNGMSGTVKDLTLFTTELATGDNVQIILPNSSVWGSPLKNYSAHPTRRVDMVYGIAYDADIDKAMSIIKAAIAADDRCHKAPEPLVVVGNLGDSSVDITTRVWCASADYWGLKFDLTKKIKEAFDAEGVDIPFPTRTVYQHGA